MRWASNMIQCTGCGNDIFFTCQPFLKQISCVICLKYMASCCGILHERCTRNYREWNGEVCDVLLARGLSEVPRGPQTFDKACQMARNFAFTLQIEGGTEVWPRKWAEEGVFPDRRILGEVKICTVLTVCSQYGVMYYDQEEQEERTIRKRFAAVKLGNTYVADETYDVPLGAIPFFYGSAEERATIYEWRLTVIDTTPVPSAKHCTPKNHIDPYPVFPKHTLGRRTGQETIEAPAPATPPTVTEAEAVEVLRDDETDISAAGGAVRELTRAAEHILIEGTETQATWVSKEQVAELEQKATAGEPKRRRMGHEASWTGRGYKLECALTTAGRKIGPAWQVGKG